MLVVYIMFGVIWVRVCGVCMLYHGLTPRIYFYLFLFSLTEAACWALDSFTNGEYDSDDDDSGDDGDGEGAGEGGDDDDEEEDEMVAAERVAAELAARAARRGKGGGESDEDDEDDDEEDDEDEESSEEEDEESSEDDDDEGDDEGDDAAKDEADAAFVTSMAELAARKGAIAQAVAAVAKFGKGRLEVAEAGCSLMVGLSQALARDEDDAEADAGGPHVLAVGGAARAIVACLRAHGATDAVLAQNCCRTMANLTAKCGTLGNTTAAAEIVAAGGFEAIVECCLVPHGVADPTTAKYGCRALYYLLIEADQAVDGGKTAVIMRGIAAGAHDAVVACLKAHPEAQEDLAEEACSAVYGLAKEAPAEAVAALTGAGAVEAVLKSLMWYGDSNDGVAKYGCMATYSLLEGMPAGGVEAFASKDGIDALVMTLIAHGAENERVAEEALTAIVAFLKAAAATTEEMKKEEGATDIVAALLSAEAAPEIVSAMKHHAEENEAVAEYGCRAIAVLLAAGGADALERFGALVGEGVIASVVTSIKAHVDGTPEMVTSACRVLSQLIEAKMCEVNADQENADQENAGVAAAQGGAAAAAAVAPKTKRKKKKRGGGRNRNKKAAKPEPEPVKEPVKDARVLAVGAGGIQGIVAAMQFHGLEEPALVEEATKALNCIMKGKAEHQTAFASLGLEGELFTGVAQ